MDAPTGLVVVVTLAAIIASFTLTRRCLADLAQTPDYELNTFTRQGWMVVLIVGSVLGAMAWITLGRSRQSP